ncbi:hypothetical protein ACU8V6_00110 [Vibrio alginolyticus]
MEFVGHEDDAGAHQLRVIQEHVDVTGHPPGREDDEDVLRPRFMTSSARRKPSVLSRRVVRPVRRRRNAILGGDAGGAEAVAVDALGAHDSVIAAEYASSSFDVRASSMSDAASSRSPAGSGRDPVDVLDTRLEPHLRRDAAREGGRDLLFSSARVPSTPSFCRVRTTEAFEVPLWVPSWAALA